MRLDFAFLANSAEICNGRFHALGGGITGIVAPQLPVTVPALGLVVQLHCPLEECGIKREITMIMKDVNANTIHAGLSKEFVAQVPLYFPERGSTAHVVFSIFGFNLTEEGIYSFEFTSEDFPLGRFELAVVVDRPRGEGG